MKKKKLDSMTEYVTQHKGTEQAFTGKYWNTFEDGSYHCKVCDQKLFESDSKYDSGSGWPSFDKAIPGSVEFHDDDRYGMHRIEVTCSKCGAHLGHMFEVGSETKTGKDYCINSCAIDLKKEEGKNEQS